MLTDRLGVVPSMGPLFAYVAERWDGKGEPGRARGDEIPLAMRIVHVARDAAFQRMLGGAEYAASVVRRRAGHAFDPEVAAALPVRDRVLRWIRLRSGKKRWPANRGRTRWIAARSTAPLPRWATLLILFRRASSDTPPVSRGWL